MIKSKMAAPPAEYYGVTYRHLDHSFLPKPMKRNRSVSMFEKSSPLEYEMSTIQIDPVLIDRQSPVAHSLSEETVVEVATGNNFDSSLQGKFTNPITLETVKDVKIQRRKSKMDKKMVNSEIKRKYQKVSKIYSTVDTDVEKERVSLKDKFNVCPPAQLSYEKTTVDPLENTEQIKERSHSHQPNPISKEKKIKITDKAMVKKVREQMRNWLQFFENSSVDHNDDSEQLKLLRRTAKLVYKSNTPQESKDKEHLESYLTEIYKESNENSNQVFIDKLCYSGLLKNIILSMNCVGKISATQIDFFGQQLQLLCYFSKNQTVATYLATNENSLLITLTDELVKLLLNLDSMQYPDSLIGLIGNMISTFNNVIQNFNLDETSKRRAINLLAKYFNIDAGIPMQHR